MARNLLAGFIGLVLALWLGGLVALMIFVTVLFRENAVAFHQSAPILFHCFEKYQLVLAALALTGTLAWRIWQEKAMLTGLFLLFVLAGAGGCMSAGVLTPKMDKLRTANQTASPEFSALHGKSMMVYSGELVALVGAGLAWTIALGKNGPPKSPSRP